ncbi:hypothetical protein ACI2KX_15870 [Ectopseudomonas khazarica]|uniref:hypothetical protein n=1 Tax=Ectopseudomonas khazarica TaxID=2502979 RepID=UPI00384B249B
MFALSYSPGAQEDVRQLKSIDPNAAALVLATVQEIRGDQNLLDSLTIHEFEDRISKLDLTYNVKHWWEHFKRGRDLWRLRVIDDENLLTDYRIIYAYCIPESKYYILGVVPRSFNYDSNHTQTKRILAEYEELCN